ncbi:hypothetical protein QZM78_11565 [Burkholderia multivorans]|nr:hypothetical protein [Burkholderia multivorans]
MKEPILSREEVIDLMYECDLPLGCESAVVDFAERIESAVLNWVCGETAAWMVLAANTGLPCEVTLHKSETEALRQDCVIPLYAINRSKS